VTETPKSTGRTTASTTGPRTTRASRFHAGLPASIWTGGAPPGGHGCRLSNLSRTGALLTQAPRLPSGSRIGLNLQSPGRGLSFRLDARVARTAVGDDGEQLGVAFLDVSDAQARQLKAFLARIVESGSPGLLRELNGDERPEDLAEILSQIPLTQRVTLAARANQAERRILFSDASPQVHAALVRNPRTRLEEILALVARPGVVAPTLEIIARDPRWRSHEDLRVRLASHPGTTLQLAERVATTLTPRGRERLLRQPGLSEPLRRKLLRRV